MPAVVKVGSVFEVPGPQKELVVVDMQFMLGGSHSVEVAFDSGAVSSVEFVKARVKDGLWKFKGEVRKP